MRIGRGFRGWRKELDKIRELSDGRGSGTDGVGAAVLELTVETEGFHPTAGESGSAIEARVPADHDGRIARTLQRQNKPSLRIPVQTWFHVLAQRKCRIAKPEGPQRFFQATGARHACMASAEIDRSDLTLPSHREEDRPHDCHQPGYSRHEQRCAPVDLLDHSGWRRLGQMRSHKQVEIHIAHDQPEHKQRKEHGKYRCRYIRCLDTQMTVTSIYRRCTPGHSAYAKRNSRQADRHPSESWLFHAPNPNHHPAQRSLPTAPPPSSGA